MISKLGYVPKESRGHSPEYFDTETVTAADRTKFRTRKRAKKSSPVTKILGGIVVLAVVAGIGFGAWYLISGNGEDTGDGLTYSALDKPCDALDTSPMKPVLDGSGTKENLNEVEKHAHSTEHDCQVSFGKPGKGGSIAVHTQVFGRDAGAENAYEDALEDAEANATESNETGGGTQTVDTVNGVGTDAYTIIRKPTEDSTTIDYTLAYYEDNAYIQTRISVFNGVASQKEVAKYTKDVAQKYMDNWASAG